MSLPKLFERIFWHNNTTPAVNETNLNAMSKGLSDIDDRLISLSGIIFEDVPIIITGLETVEQAVIDSQEAAGTASAKALISEGWAQGTQDGVPVGSSSPYYNKSAAYYAAQMAALETAFYNLGLSVVDGKVCQTYNT